MCEKRCMWTCVPICVQAWVWSQVLYLITHHFIFLCQGLPLNPGLVNSRKSSRAACSGAVSWEPGLQMIAMLARLFPARLFLQLFIIGKRFACQCISAAPKDFQIWLVMSLINVTVNTCGLLNLYAPVVLAALAVKAEGHPQPYNKSKVNLGYTRSWL